jgi:hypothetical protein
MPMEQFAKQFIRETEGSWLCVEPAELQTPSGRIQVAPGTKFTRGTSFMGVDVAMLLEEQYEKNRTRS